jgi:hypothetical protein
MGPAWHGNGVARRQWRFGNMWCWVLGVSGYMEFGGSIPTLIGILHKRNQAFIVKSSFRSSLEVPTALWKFLSRPELKLEVVKSRKWMKPPAALY